MDNCLEAARVCGVNRVVYASSIDVNGAQRHFGERLITEDDAKYGTTQYAVHKIFNEFVAAQYEKIYGMSIIGIRAANVTGHDKVRGSVDHVKCITLPAAEHPVSFPKKDYMRLPIHVQDVAEGFVRVTLADTVHHSLYNGGGTAISLGDLADMVRGFSPTLKFLSIVMAGTRATPTTWWTTAVCWRSSNWNIRLSPPGSWRSSTTCARTQDCPGVIRTRQSIGGSCFTFPFAPPILVSVLETHGAPLRMMVSLSCQPRRGACGQYPPEGAVVPLRGNRPSPLKNTIDHTLGTLVVPR